MRTATASMDAVNVIAQSGIAYWSHLLSGSGARTKFAVQRPNARMPMVARMAIALGMPVLLRQGSFTVDEGAKT